MGAFVRVLASFSGSLIIVALVATPSLVVKEAVVSTGQPLVPHVRLAVLVTVGVVSIKVVATRPRAIVRASVLGTPTEREALGINVTTPVPVVVARATAGVYGMADGPNGNVAIAGRVGRVSFMVIT